MVQQSDLSRIYDKIDSVSRDVAAIREELSGKRACEQQCAATNKAMFGNGGLGVKAKVRIIWWGLTAALGAGITAAVTALVYNLLRHSGG